MRWRVCPVRAWVQPGPGAVGLRFGAFADLCYPDRSAEGFEAFVGYRRGGWSLPARAPRPMVQGRRAQARSSTVSRVTSHLPVQADGVIDGDGAPALQPGEVTPEKHRAALVEVMSIGAGSRI